MFSHAELFAKDHREIAAVFHKWQLEVEIMRDEARTRLLTVHTWRLQTREVEMTSLLGSFVQHVGPIERGGANWKQSLGALKAAMRAVGLLDGHD